ncbi:MAG TPA: DUF1501 domain-containing protein [Xanthobacteraceae bacterium]|nr:DUF1501 domain-containing protein [Xanthobacteraceae bacterium]
MNRFQISRRHLLTGAGAFFAWAHAPKLARAEGRDPRLLTIVLRGGLDGLATVAPIGDPNWVSSRGDLALTPDSKTPARKLDNFFALHPSMPNLHRMYQAGQATIVHAATTPYRDRSHFDGQDVLESGFAKTGFTSSGWLNRALQALVADDLVKGQGTQVFAVGPVTPLVVRGAAPILVWAPQQVVPASEDTLMRLHGLYKQNDPQLARVLEERTTLAGILQSEGVRPTDSPDQAGRAAKLRTYYAEALAGAAQALAHNDGPRVGALALEGWDTHASEGIVSGQLNNMLGALDNAIAVAETTMGPAAWKETVIVVVTEFGRTVKMNGSNGTDHGTATVALLAGGAVKGGRVIADWPGLKEADLYEGRDLKPTLDIRAVLKGLLSEHLRADDVMLDTDVFPGTENLKFMAGLTHLPS